LAYSNRFCGRIKKGNGPLQNRDIALRPKNPKSAVVLEGYA
jgi:hypothetical protein